MNSLNMTEENRKILLSDICARLPYGIKFKANNEECVREIHYIKDENVYVREYQNLPYWIDTIKPFLRPMSSMTEEEKTEYRNIAPGIEWNYGIQFPTTNKMDWLNAHHFDYRNLIERGLALEAPEGMY